MRKLFIAALVLAVGCDATRRDFSYCDQDYPVCEKGFVCDLSVGKCIPETDGGLPDAPWSTNEGGPPEDVLPAEAGDSIAIDGPTIDGPATDVSIVIDGPIVDGPQVDVGAIDTRVPDAPGTCTVDADCQGTGLPYCQGFKCVACKTNSHCSSTAGTPFCSAQNTCVSCALDTSGAVCAGATPICDAVSGQCVECLSNSTCTADPAKAFCVAGSCQGCHVPGASATGSGPAGTVDGGASGGVDAGIAFVCTGAKPVCATSGGMLGQCVECMTSADCAGTTPICDNSNTCAPCTSDSQCAALLTGPGICMYHQDSRCASEAETIYVKKTAGCSGGAGTATSPYCDMQSAFSAVTSSKRVILAKGPATDVLAPIASTPSGGQISIISKDEATFNGGGAVGVHVTTGDIYLRGITVANGSDRGVVVDTGATLRMDRCIIKKNAGGGLLAQSGASFDIANSVFDENGEGTVGPVKFGGVYLAGSAPSSGPHRLWFNTVINNQQTGVVCADSTQAFTGMLIYSNIGGGYLNCAADSSNSKWDSPGTGSDVSDPRLSTTNPYHLTATPPPKSRCIDFVDPVEGYPDHDLDGELRPYNGKFDCGADEYHP